MGNEIIASTINALSQIIAKLPARQTKKQDSLLFTEQLAILKHQCRLRGLELLTQESLAQLQNTWDTIQKNHYTGELLAGSKVVLQLQLSGVEMILRSYLQF